MTTGKFILTEAISMLVGRTIECIRPINNQELAQEGWDHYFCCMVIVLDDGAKLYPSRDPEGNSPGCLFGELADGTPILVA